MPTGYVVCDTNIFRYVAKSDFQAKFLEVCQKPSIEIVTLIQVEQQIHRNPACRKLFTLLKANGIIRQYTTPQRLKAHEEAMYTTLRMRMEDADAAIIPVAILNDWVLLTNDEDAVTAFGNSFPALQPKLKPMSFESFLYLAYQRKIIDEKLGQAILTRYKKSCFRSPAHQNRRIKGRNFIEMITFLYEQKVSPVQYFP